MVTSPKKITVRATPGKNAAVDHVVRLEDLLQQMQQGAAKPARGRGGAPAKGAGDLTAILQLATELEARMRDLRGSPSRSPGAAPARRSGGSKKKV